MSLCCPKALRMSPDVCELWTRSDSAVHVSSGQQSRDIEHRGGYRDLGRRVWELSFCSIFLNA